MRPATGSPGRCGIMQRARTHASLHVHLVRERRRGLRGSSSPSSTSASFLSHRRMFERLGFQNMTAEADSQKVRLLGGDLRDCPCVHTQGRCGGAGSAGAAGPAARG